MSPVSVCRRHSGIFSALPISTDLLLLISERWQFYDSVTVTINTGQTSLNGLYGLMVCCRAHLSCVCVCVCYVVWSIQLSVANTFYYFLKLRVLAPDLSGKASCMCVCERERAAVVCRMLTINPVCFLFWFFKQCLITAEWTSVFKAALSRPQSRKTVYCWENIDYWLLVLIETTETRSHTTECFFNVSNVMFWCESSAYREFESMLSKIP